MPNNFKSVFTRKRDELKQKMKVTDELLKELLNHKILTPDDINSVKVSYCSMPAVAEAYVEYQ